MDFDRFFNGALPFPPEEQRNRLRRLLRRARSQRQNTFAERFHLNSLEARFNTLSELFNRRLREQEMGSSAKKAMPREAPRRHEDGVILGRSLDVEAVTTLYNELYNSKGRETKTDFDSFQRFLHKQVADLTRRSGCDRIRFRVSQVKGRPTLKAKPLGVAD